MAVQSLANDKEDKNPKFEPTSNLLIFRNKDEDVVFKDKDDVEKFSLKFVSLGLNYKKNWAFRAEIINNLK